MNYAVSVWDCPREEKERDARKGVCVCPGEAGMFIACATKQIGKRCKKKLGDQHSVQKKFNHLCR